MPAPLFASVIPAARRPTRRPSAGAASAWVRLTLAGGMFLTGFEAFLLQERKFFFTGGFLAVDHARGAADVLAFLLASFATDAAVVGLAVAAGLWLFGLIRLNPAARAVAVMLLALAPLIIADFANHRLVAHLGDAFDLGLMFDLTGRRPGEILAVSAAHLVAPALVLAALGTVAGGVVWATNRFRSGAASAMRLPLQVFATAVGFFLAVLVTTTAVRAYSDMMENGLRRKPSGQLLARFVALATDFDRDGYGLGGFMPDPAPFDANIFPYAKDIPGNGIDENGVGGDLPAGTTRYVEEHGIAEPWQHKPDVVLIVLESFRADAVGAVIDGKPVTPVLDELTRRGASAAAAFSHNGYTAQSRFHIMSGSLAGLRGGRTLVDDFQANGYEVAYFSGQDESFGGPELGVGFERADVAYDARQDRARRYSTFATAGSLAVPHEAVQERVTAFLARRTRDRPLFLYVNFHDTHYPYHHPGIRPLVTGTVLREAEIVPRNVHSLRRMYFNTAANVDRAIGATLDAVRQHLTAPPAVIVTADHGESLFDEGFLGHGYALNDAQTRIPLIVAGLPITIQEPFGQLELRDAIGAALAAGHPLNARPEVRTPAGGKTVFQYLGSVDRPRQIAFANGATRTIYDFRTREVRIAGGPWMRTDGLASEGSERFLELVHFWERVVLARRGITIPEDE